MKAISVAVKTKDDQTDLWHSLLDMVSRYCKLPALRDLQMESPAVRCLVVLRALLHIAVHLRSSDKGAQWKVFRIGLLKNILSLLPTSIQTCLQGLLNRSEENEPSLSADIGPYTFDGDESVPRAGRFIPVVDLEEFLYALAVWTQSYPGFPVIVEIDNDVPLPGDMLFFLEQIEVTKYAFVLVCRAFNFCCISVSPSALCNTVHS